ncbi:hypothetical protein MK852_17005 [Shewanella benthica]|uniref:hypothetical protein n=1 Tax=Shewanella benthica TaxID=43661 RepID=UPI00187A525C|nr:hypothetical protein [Shewanella benthica]MBE7216120.1 hypothetical protein [Shewanella benthica]MCL1063813.1 hypothetical protein [Shewanella benthica]
MAAMLMRILTLTLLLTLVGCGDDRPDKIAQFQQLAGKRIDTLGQMLNDGQIRNAMLLKQYTSIMERQNPDMAPLFGELAKDATTKGPMYTSLVSRYRDLSNASNYVDLDQQLAEAENIYYAADSSLYNDMISDPLNVVADMSNGALARVNSISREASALANGADDFGAGSQLVGNPGYGSWQTGSSGTSFWAWYGMYSMFSNVMRGPIGYDRWSGRRNYSYYNDVGRYRYTSPKQASAQNKTFERTKKQFSSQGKKFDSPYAKSRSGSTSLSRQSTSTPKASTTGTRSKSSSKFRSNYSKNSNFRNSNSRTTRGVRRGK